MNGIIRTKQVGLVLFLLASLVFPLLTSIPQQHPARADYSYTHYREVHRVIIPPCTLPSVEEGGRMAENGGLVCLETGQLPTTAQTNVWEGYVLWVSCKEYHSEYACDLLSD